MSLLEQQNLIARLYLDEDLRHAFFADAPGAAAPFGLSDEEITEIGLLVPAEIGSFADSLLKKRLHEAEKMLPLTRRVLHERFASFFIKYRDATPSSQEMDLRDDVLEFCRYLEREATGAVRDAARFELAKMEFYSGKRNFLVRRFEHDVHNGRLAERRRTYGIWIRINKRVFSRVY